MRRSRHRAGGGWASSGVASSTALPRDPAHSCRRLTSIYSTETCPVPLSSHRPSSFSRYTLTRCIAFDAILCRPTGSERRPPTAQTLNQTEPASTVPKAPAWARKCRKKRLIKSLLERLEWECGSASAGCERLLLAILAGRQSRSDFAQRRERASRREESGAQACERRFPLPRRAPSQHLSALLVITRTWL